ncbi:hypothetical protein BDP27DRAFT_1338605 [Rhodocollybia butyracea]|uniref:Uncharacterized protein n=1 Tax=Rhodocollybia butyracea TaxID=206335 RepID=A0A9P5PEA2_9AGAR|nr:hypothetical protein BDP27DRAFT_1338605 [Rhodocollybia butyracea]
MTHMIQPDMAKNPDTQRPWRPQKPWMEQWEEIAGQRSKVSYDMNNHRVNRFHQATQAFRHDRYFPYNLRDPWDQFQMFIGIMNIIPVWILRDQLREEVEDDADDDDDYTADSNNKATRSSTYVQREEKPRANGKRDKKGQRPRPPYENYNRRPVVVENDEEIQQLVQESHDRKADRADQFLDNPARSIQIYLSSYMMQQGFHYTERNLTLIPHIIRFYVEFLLNERFLAHDEAETEASLRRSLTIIELALSELPLTSKIMKHLPWNDKFTQGCKQLFGVAENMLQVTSVIPSTTDFTSGDLGEQTSVNELKVDDIPTVEPYLDEIIKHGEALPIYDILSGTSDVWPPEGVVLEGPPTPISLAADSDWGSTDTSAIWGSLDESMSLLPLLGPTALPLTHTTGVVEQSVRKVVSITDSHESLPFVVKFDLDKSSEGPSAKAVEEEISIRLSKVVLEPWLGWPEHADEIETKVPHILGNSRGRVVVYDDGQSVIYDHGSDSFRSSADDPSIRDSLDAKAPAHDPLQHSITLLLDPESTKMLRLGMGLVGTWVQIARNVDLDLDSMSSIGEGTENVDRSAPQRFWYLRDLKAVLPSYHTDVYQPIS